MRKRKIAVVGLADDASHAFRSMLRIVDGRGGISWTLAAPDEADVLLAGVHSGEEVVKPWARTNKPLIAVYEGAATRPLTPYTLHHPFRVMQLLGVLDDVDLALAGAAPNEPARPTHRIGDASWGFAESLRLLARSSSSGQFYVAGHGHERLFVRDDLSAYYASTDMAQRLAHTALDLPALVLSSQTPPAQFECRPVFELAWFTGLHGPETPAPWLDRQAAHRLRRWPDFGRLRGTRDQLALAALLTHGSYSRTRLIETSRQSAGRVDRFLNACALSGVLHSSNEAIAANDATNTFVANSAARLGGLIRGLRSRLGLTG
ncbi:hypothetical protein DFR29_101164 [Tahibacter aquaticus]|uniref:Uncharacterized protein n=1 Tax=Tahibacter aquaticus TaxID=520092 RepID=A0A4R6Z9Y6_9GAMM|nr:hypothetical protein [Tahibacter aquaticus]TDR48544.1 hypothetical protein DFR29_101164 [Tahibacter aquaticus]